MSMRNLMTSLRFLPLLGRLKNVSLNILLPVLVVCMLFSCRGESQESGDNTQKVQLWLTTADGRTKFAKQPDIYFNKNIGNQTIITIDSSRTFQEVDGFGYTLTGGSAMLLSRMDASARSSLLKEMFSTDGIGVSYLRISIGSSDLDERVFSYADLPDGETDPHMERFSLEPDRAYLIPVLKEILQIFPDLKIMASPWSPPAWMKTNNSSVGGSLLKEYYEAYALYFVRYIKGMAAEGIQVDAVTVQNEPLHPGNNPSMLMLPAEQTEFIGEHLGPAFVREGIRTKIIIYDHNADRIEYPLEVLADITANRYIDGSAFHLYGGDIKALSRVHEAYPDKNLYFTEQWIGAPSDFGGDLRWHIREVIIGSMRNWCRTALEWNLAADPDQKPHTDGGCTRCLGAVTIDGNRFERNTAWYVIAHAAKFTRPGSLRIWSSAVEGLPNVAFITPEGSKVLIVLNDQAEKKEFGITSAGRSFRITIEGGAVATLVW